MRDIALVATIMRSPFVMEVKTSFPAKTVSEFIAHAKANPGKLSMALAGVGSGPHVAGGRGLGCAYSEPQTGLVVRKNSPIVGTSGSASDRVAVVTARARSAAPIWSMDDGIPSI
jgi:hypothetical protein